MIAPSLEDRVRKEWRGLGYGRFGLCSSCGILRDPDGKPVYVRGHSTETLVCLQCFDLYGAPRREIHEATRAKRRED